jgi:hypothetical protein
MEQLQPFIYHLFDSMLFIAFFCDIIHLNFDRLALDLNVFNAIICLCFTRFRSFCLLKTCILKANARARRSFNFATFFLSFAQFF